MESIQSDRLWSWALVSEHCKPMKLKYDSIVLLKNSDDFYGTWLTKDLKAPILPPDLEICKIARVHLQM